MRYLQHYALGERIGKGGFGEVFLARDTALDIDVAVKVLLPMYAANTEMVERFRLGARAAANLQHPNIIRVFYLGEIAHEQIYFTVMEYLSGGTLADHIKRSLTPDEAIKSFVKIAQALDFAHAKGFIHRDIKPSNILYRADGEPIITDFDFSRVMGGQRLTKDDSVYGTLRYLAPEQANGEDVSPQSDIYSLGVMLFELLTRQLPYDSPELATILYLHLRGDIPKASRLNTDLPRAMDRVIEKAMAKRPELRYETATEFAEAAADAFYGRNQTGAISAPSIYDSTTSDHRIKQSLMLLNGPKEGQSVHLSKTPFTVGYSAADNDLGLEDDYASTHHGRFERTNVGWVYIDQNSSNGSYLVLEAGRKRRLKPEIPHTLSFGDVLELGDTLLRFDVGY